MYVVVDIAAELLTYLIGVKQQLVGPVLALPSPGSSFSFSDFWAGCAWLASLGRTPASVK